LSIPGISDAPWGTAFDAAKYSLGRFLILQMTTAKPLSARPSKRLIEIKKGYLKNFAKFINKNCFTKHSFV